MNTNKSILEKASARASELCRQILPGVVEADVSFDGIFSVLGTEELAQAARPLGLEVIDWSADKDFVACGTPFEVYITMADLERLLRGR
jgi:hypothetical protein